MRTGFLFRPLSSSCVLVISFIYYEHCSLCPNHTSLYQSQKTTLMGNYLDLRFSKQHLDVLCSLSAFHFCSWYRLSCGKSKSYNVEKFQSKQELKYTLDRTGQTQARSRGSEPQKTNDSPQMEEILSKGNASYFTPLQTCLHFCICLKMKKKEGPYHKTTYLPAIFLCSPFLTSYHYKSHLCTPFFTRQQLQELCPVLVLSLASDIAFSPAAASLSFHWNAEPNAEATGKPRPSYW